MTLAVLQALVHEMNLFDTLAEILWKYCPLFTRGIQIFNFQKIVTWERQGFSFVIAEMGETSTAQYSETP